MRLSELNQTAPCPPYVAASGETYLDLKILQPPPTVGACVVAIEALGIFIEKWGAKLIAFTFGSGSLASINQGDFKIAYGRPPYFNID